MAATLEDYDVGDFLGSGGFASVHRAYCRRQQQGTGESCDSDSNSRSDQGGVCAIKIINKVAMQEHGPAHQDRVNNEIKVHQLMNHPNVVRLRDRFEDGRNMYMVLDLCEGGNLFKYLGNMGPMQEDVAAHVTRQILLALDYMHSKGVVHRDLKLSNVLISDTSTMSIKICDFGLAVLLQHPDEEHFTLCGTPNYIAPEIAGQTAYGYPADLWAVGCLFYCMVTGTPPFGQRDVPTTLQRILTGQYAEPTFLSAEALDFLHQLLQMDPLKRASAHQMCNHPFIVMCSATSEELSDIASRLAKVATVAKKKRRSSGNSKREARTRRSADGGSFIRSSGDDTDLQVWRMPNSSTSSDGVVKRDQRQNQGMVSCPYNSPQQQLLSRYSSSSSCLNSSAASFASSSYSPRSSMSGLAGRGSYYASERGSCNDAASELILPRYLLTTSPPSVDGGVGVGDDQSTLNVNMMPQPKQCPNDEPLSWRHALGHANKGKVEAVGLNLSRSLSSADRYYLSAVSATGFTSPSLNSSVDSATASVSFCHGRMGSATPGTSLFRSPSTQHCAQPSNANNSSSVKNISIVTSRPQNKNKSQSKEPLPLLHLPPDQALMHRSSNGDLLVCSSSGDVVFCSRVAAAQGTVSPHRGGTVASIFIRLLIKKKTQFKISLCRLDEDMTISYRGIIEQSPNDAGFSFLSDSESNVLTMSALFSENPSRAVFSVREVPRWVALKYKKMHRVLETVKCRLPRFVLYVSSIAVLQGGRVESVEHKSSTELDITSSICSSDNTIDNLNSLSGSTVYCKCMLMSNGPLPDFCVQWADGVKLRYSLASSRLHLSSPNDPPQLPMYQWVGDTLTTGAPSWTATAPTSVKEYLVVAQAAMQRCLEEQDRRKNNNIFQSSNSSSSGSNSNALYRDKIIFI